MVLFLRLPVASELPRNGELIWRAHRLDRAGDGTYSRAGPHNNDPTFRFISHDRCPDLSRLRLLDRRRSRRHAGSRQDYRCCLHRRRARQAGRCGHPRNIRHAVAYQRHRTGRHTCLDRHAGHGAATHRGMAGADHGPAGDSNRSVDAVDAKGIDHAIARRAADAGACARSFTRSRRYP